MKTVQRLLFITLMVLLPLSVSVAQEKAAPGTLPAPTTVYQAKFPITLPSGEYELVSTILEFAPGAGVARHMHGGQVLVVVLGGEMTLREKGTERIKKQGESWTENPGDEHSVINAGDVTARVAVSMLLPKGAEATTLIKQ
jgi:quercetin dioxygenase-like cupin family protein